MAAALRAPPHAFIWAPPDPCPIVALVQHVAALLRTRAGPGPPSEPRAIVVQGRQCHAMRTAARQQLRVEPHARPPPGALATGEAALLAVTETVLREVCTAAMLTAVDAGLLDGFAYEARAADAPSPW